jgi:hypothetical protein
MTIELRILQHDDASILNSVAPDVFDDPIVAQADQEFLHDRVTIWLSRSRTTS